jgi:hypothetical protein
VAGTDGGDDAALRGTRVAPLGAIFIEPRHFSATAGVQPQGDGVAPSAMTRSLRGRSAGRWLMLRRASTGVGVEPRIAPWRAAVLRAATP